MQKLQTEEPSLLKQNRVSIQSEVALKLQQKLCDEEVIIMRKSLLDLLQSEASWLTIHL